MSLPPGFRLHLYPITLTRAIRCVSSLRGTSYPQGRSPAEIQTRRLDVTLEASTRVRIPIIRTKRPRELRCAGPLLFEIRRRPGRPRPKVQLPSQNVQPERKRLSQSQRPRPPWTPGALSVCHGPKEKHSTPLASLIFGRLSCSATWGDFLKTRAFWKPRPRLGSELTRWNGDQRHDPRVSFRQVRL